MTHLVSRSKIGFSLKPLHKRKEPHAFHYLAERTSFWVAVLSVIAFVSGNMIGQHGWQVFWKSVMGHENDSLIVYTGTVTPLALVPDYSRWAAYGGNATEHTYRQVPLDALKALPPYANTNLDPAYSVGYMGSYTTGAEGTGSHPGVDIRVPSGTPVRTIAAGIVDVARDDGNGFGKLICVRHPNIPNPDRPTETTVLESCYAHLSSIQVSEGSVLAKGDLIGLSGMSGDASGPHLHFQIDRGEAPWHPYWPFNSSDLRQAGINAGSAINTGFQQANGYSFTVNPMPFVQANYRPVAVAANATGTAQTAVKPAVPVVRQSMASLVERRKSERMARLKVAAITRLPATQVVSTQTVVSQTTVTEPDVPAAPVTVVNTPVMSTPQKVATVDIQTPDSYSDRGWVTVRLTLLDATGEPVKNPRLERNLVLRTAFGNAEFQPASLSSIDFLYDGTAEVKMLPHESRTVVVEVQPYGVISDPLKFDR